MAGLVGTLGMLAEACGCAAVLDVAAVPRPAGATVGDWFTCFPGFAMLTAAEPGRARRCRAGPATSARVRRADRGRGRAIALAGRRTDLGRRRDGDRHGAGADRAGDLERNGGAAVKG